MGVERGSKITEDFQEAVREEKEMNEHIKNKISSGRWLLTMATAVAFVVLVVAYILGKPSISGDAIAALVGSVFANYFSMARKEESPK
jgi:succinate dehydrogenase hydrophobic anchor subunit